MFLFPYLIKFIFLIQYFPKLKIPPKIAYTGSITRLKNKIEGLEKYIYFQYSNESGYINKGIKYRFNLIKQLIKEL